MEWGNGVMAPPELGSPLDLGSPLAPGAALGLHSSARSPVPGSSKLSKLYISVAALGV